MEKVTYTKKQLELFTIKELKTIDLFSEINFKKGMIKSDIVKGMLKVQKSKTKPKTVKVETPKVDKIGKVQIKDNVKKEVKDEPKFHRNNGIKRRSRFTHM